MSNGSNPVNWQAACELAQRETSKARAQLRSSAKEIGRLRAALEAVAAPSEYLVMHPEAQARINVARAALATPTTETPE